MADSNSPETNQGSENKRSKNPIIQEAVQEEGQRLKAKYPTLPEEHVNQQARDRIAAEIVRERLRRELGQAKELAQFDALTGLHNRRWFEEDLERRIAHGQRTGKSFWLLYIDFDRFKLVNDTYGHPVGDEIIRLAAKLPARVEEPISRLGGEEFAQTMNEDIKLEDIPYVMTRYMDTLREESAAIFREANTRKKLPFRERLRRTTMSFGAALWEGESAKELVNKADLAMLHAKDRGRNTGYVAHKTRSEKITFLKINKLKTAK